MTSSPDCASFCAYMGFTVIYLIIESLVVRWWGFRDDAESFVDRARAGLWCFEKLPSLRRLHCKSFSLSSDDFVSHQKINKTVSQHIPSPSTQYFVDSQRIQSLGQNFGRSGQLITENRLNSGISMKNDPESSLQTVKWHQTTLQTWVFSPDSGCLFLALRIHFFNNFSDKATKRPILRHGIGRGSCWDVGTKHSLKFHHWEWFADVICCAWKRNIAYKCASIVDRVWWRTGGSVWIRIAGWTSSV